MEGGGKNMKDLKLHILSLKVFNCDECKEAFRTAEEKEKHKETHHFNCKTVSF